MRIEVAKRKPFFFHAKLRKDKPLYLMDAKFYTLFENVYFYGNSVKKSQDFLVFSVGGRYFRKIPWNLFLRKMGVLGKVWQNG